MLKLVWLLIVQMPRNEFVIFWNYRAAMLINYISSKNIMQNPLIFHSDRTWPAELNSCFWNDWRSRRQDVDTKYKKKNQIWLFGKLPFYFN